jgi:hypothetical protein
MKKIFKRLIYLPLIAFFAAAAGCESAPDQKQAVEAVDHKGALFGMPEPAWVTAYPDGGNRGVESALKYKDLYCFVVYCEDTDKDFAIGQANSTGSLAQISGLVSAVILDDAKARAAAAGTENPKAAESPAAAVSYMSLGGLQKTGDWWRIVRDKKTQTESCQAFVLYTIEKKIFNTQLAGRLEAFINSNETMPETERSIYLDIIKDIRINGFTNR